MLLKSLENKAVRQQCWMKLTAQTSRQGGPSSSDGSCDTGKKEIRADFLLLEVKRMKRLPHPDHCLMTDICILKSSSTAMLVVRSREKLL